MSNEDGTLWISYNGEIYNHADIRRVLEEQGSHRWKTDHSDTEVILHAFEEWGIDCLDRFRGMFAFSLWDARKRQLWLVRDRIGIKPLYHSLHHGRVTFASEIKALLQDPEQERAVDEEALYHYLSFLTTPGPQSLFAGVQKLPAGTWLRISEDGQALHHRYWDVWDYAAPLTGQPVDGIAERVLGELREAVRLRRIADVPVGVFLSGGIDSSVNAALFSEGERASIQTFSIGYAGEHKTYQNELHFARKMAAQVCADHHECLLTADDLIEFVPKMVHLQDEPIADPVCVPLYYLSKLARGNGVEVCQVGEGADEIFIGYPSWKTRLTLQRLDDLPLPTALKDLSLRCLSLVGMKQSNPYELLRRGAAQQPIFWGGAEAFTEAEKQWLISGRLRKQFSGLTSWEPLRSIRSRFEDRAWDPSHLNWMTYLDLSLRLPELLLMRVDKMSMGVSLESRVPFLDHKLVELSLSIPSELKLGPGVLKYMLKKAVRGVIPDELIDRKKQGFDVPLGEWFAGGLRDRISTELEWFCHETDLLDQDAVRSVVDRGTGSKAWFLYNLAVWWRTYIS